MAWQTVIFDDNGGSGGSGILYLNYTHRLGVNFYNYWATAQSTSESYRITGCSIPTKPGCEFLGYAGPAGTIFIGKSGYLYADLYSGTSYLPTTLTAMWASSYMVTFDKNGGDGGTSSLYYKVGGGIYSDSECTIPAASIAPPAKYLNKFFGYFSKDHNLKYVNPDGSFTPGLTSLVLHDNLTIYAAWDTFGNLTDYYGLETENGPLVLVESSDGATRSVTETTGSTGTGANLKCGALAITVGDSAVGAFARGGILLCPTCTYRIRRPGTIQLKLGKAYGMATVSGIGTQANPYRATRSGYMLANAEYSTAADGEPVLTVRGAANEGYVWNGSTMRAQLTDAINRWNVDLVVSPDHIAQDPMGAVSGGGELTECRTLVTCDPIVPTEGGMPCASDVVRGKVVVTATTAAYFGESAPTAVTPFIETNGVPASDADVDFTNYDFTAERSL